MQHKIQAASRGKVGRSTPKSQPDRELHLTHVMREQIGTAFALKFAKGVRLPIWRNPCESVGFVNDAFGLGSTVVSRNGGYQKRPVSPFLVTKCHDQDGKSRAAIRASYQRREKCGNHAQVVVTLRGGVGDLFSRIPWEGYSRTSQERGVEERRFVASGSCLMACSRRGGFGKIA